MHSCCHQGRTPPCTDLLIERRPARVVVAMHDPNPRVAGQGIFQLREAGIEVEVGLLEDEARRLNEAFIKYITTQMPFVIAKCGMSLDGKIATRAGDARWVTGETSRRMVHRKALTKGKFDGRPVVPTRFTRACPRGHIDDLDWRLYVHGPGDSCKRQLWLDERGAL